MLSAILNNLLNGLCFGAALFLPVFFFQGPYWDTPLIAGLSIIPFGLSFIIVGPLSGRWSDKYGPRTLTISGPALMATAFLGLAFINHATPFWLIVTLEFMMGIGGALFSSPNTSSIMKAVPPECRGTASGTRLMLRNTGQMFSLAFAFPLVLSGIPIQDVLNLFVYGGGISPQALATFESGLHDAFLLFFFFAVASTLIAMMRPRKKIEQ